MTIQAIEVEYKGHRFRSKTEAKWAVFFDQIGVCWEYEPQGYTFEGYSYLPDFYLPERQMFIEIKPQDIQILQDQTPRWMTFRNHIGKPLLVLAGHPWLREFHAMLVYRHQDEIRARTVFYAEMLLFRGLLCFASEKNQEFNALPFLRTNMSRSHLETACRITRQYRFAGLW